MWVGVQKAESREDLRKSSPKAFGAYLKQVESTVKTAQCWDSPDTRWIPCGSTTECEWGDSREDRLYTVHITRSCTWGERKFPHARKHWQTGCEVGRTLKHFQTLGNWLKLKEFYVSLYSRSFDSNIKIFIAKGWWPENAKHVTNPHPI